MSDLSVVLLSHNRHEELQKNVPRLCDFVEQDGLELVLVDNDSTDGSQSYLKGVNDAHEDVTVILNDKNRGVAGGRNSGLRHTTREFVICIDDDLALTRVAIEGLRETARSNPDAGIITPKIIHPESGNVQNDHGESLTEVGNYHGACHLIRREVLDSVGGIDPKCTFGGEELDFSIRVHAAGFDVLYQPDVEVYHNNFERPEAENVRRRKMRVYNHARINFKYFSRRTGLLFSFRYLISHLYNGAGILGVTGVRKVVTAYVCGIIDGHAERTTIPPETIEYYTRESRRPDTGNVPLLKKL